MRRLSGILLAVAIASGCAARQRSDIAGAQRAIAREAIARNEWRLAFSAADEACRSKPKDPEGWVLRGRVYRELHLAAEAEADLREALRVDSRYAPAHSSLAVLLDESRRSDEAMQHHRKAAELEPRNAQYLNNLGFALFISGRSREAVPILLDALRASPADSRIRNNLGFAYAAAGDLTRAAEQFDLAGTPAEARNNLAFAYERRGDFSHAFELYVDALRIDSGSEGARVNLERVSRLLGREIPADVAKGERDSREPS